MLFVIVISFFILGCAEQKRDNTSVIGENQEIRLVFATDIHYLSPDLLSSDSAFIRALERGDGKMTHYSPEITEAFLDEVIRIKPHALILGGDISFNGEKKSHTELARKLNSVRDAGITVLAVPGNHDINRPNAYQYLREGIRRTPSVTQKQFRDIYYPLGAVNAVSFDSSSLSFVYRLSEDVQVIMLDTSQYQKGNVKEGGRISDKTLSWLEKELALASKSNITVITVMHHSLLPHNSMFNSNFVIEDYRTVVNLLERYGVRLNLSGHIHVQHIKREEDSGIYDISTNALAVFPNYYALITINPDKSIEYRANRVNVSKWAERNRIRDANLLNFEAYSLEFMSRSSFFKTSQTLSDYNMSEEDRNLMIEFAQTLNTNYFAGIITEINPENTAYKLWLEHYPQERFIRYLNSILIDKTPSTELVIR